MATRPMLDLQAGYVTRADGRLPHQGTGVWSVPKSYRTDARRLLRESVDDGVLEFSSAPVRAGRGQPAVTGSLTAATATGMPVSCNMPLTGSNDPGPLGPSRFTLTPG